MVLRRVLHGSPALSVSVVCRDQKTGSGTCCLPKRTCLGRRFRLIDRPGLPLDFRLPQVYPRPSHCLTRRRVVAHLALSRDVGQLGERCVRAVDQSCLSHPAQRAVQQVRELLPLRIGCPSWPFSCPQVLAAIRSVFSPACIGKCLNSSLFTLGGSITIGRLRSASMVVM